jgi:HD-GYP domain-containing protein (c-di-GMP phosphodiesterase class II)
MNTINLVQLKPGMVCDGDIFLDEQALLVVLIAGLPIPHFLIKELALLGFQQLYTNGNGILTEIIEEVKEDPLDKYQHEIAQERTQIEQAIAIYQKWITTGTDLYEKYKATNRLYKDILHSLMKEIVTIYPEHKGYLLRFYLFDHLGHSYFMRHALETIFLALAAVKTLKLPSHRLVEIATTCFLHEIGLLKLPPELLDEDKILDERERRLLSSHVAVGYNTLQNMEFPQDISLGVLHHHERLDGSGYLQGLHNEQIAFYAKIVSLVCTYHALVSRRPYRKSIPKPVSFIELINDTRGKYDSHLVKSLLSALAIYPMGAYVRLSDHSIAIVSDIDGCNPMYPVVTLLYNAEGLRIKEEKLIYLDTKLYILALLGLDEIKQFN